MQLVPNAHSYVSYRTAKLHLHKVFGPDLDQLRWFIIAQEDGRFTPAIHFDTDAQRKLNLAAVIEKNIAVIG